MKFNRFLTLVLVLAVAMIGTQVWAQGSQTGTISGAVKDSNGDALPGVTVTVTSPSLLGERTGFTGSNGDFVLRGLPPGTYKVVFELSGMTTVERTATVELGRTARSDAEMQVASVEETIVVRGETPSALASTAIGANYTQETIDALPTSRTLSGIAQLAPGLTNNTPNGGQVTIAGAFAYDNVFLVDGVDVNDNLFGTANNLFIEDAIEETQVLTNGISAEYGRFSGGVINAITKSGGNNFSGSFRADFTNPSWRNETPLEETRGIEREDSTNEIFQATLGGPVIKDRLWFFLAGRDSETSNPTVFQFTNVPKPNDVVNERYEIKLTGNISSSHTLQAAYVENETTQTSSTFGFSIDPRTVRTRTLPNELSQISYNGVWTANLFGELRYSEKEFGFRNSGGTSTLIQDSPFITNNFALGHFNQPYFDSTDPEDRNNEQVAGSLSYFLSTAGAGSHDIKFGGEQFTSTRTGGNSQSATSFVFDADFVLNPDGSAALDPQGRIIPTFVPFDTFIENWIAVRGATIDIETTSLFINDKWNLNDHWSFNIGFRYEDVQGDATGGLKPVDTSQFVPRLAASYDVKGDGKFKIDATYAQYSGKYSEAQFGESSNVGNPSLLFGVYAGPAGQGVDFAPGFDPNNYIYFFASDPTANVFFDPDLSSPVNEEFTLSAGMEIGRGGWLKATYTQRSLSDFVEDFILFENGQTNVVIGGVGAVADNVVFRNTDIPERDYKGLLVQGRYRLTNNWLVEGHWTYQIENDGNFEGEGTNTPGTSSAFGDRPEIQAPNRQFPTGRLNDFQRHKVRLWTTYNWDFGRFGNLSSSLLYRYDSKTSFSLTASVPLASTNLAANDPGYAGSPTNITVFFGERGSQSDPNDSHLFDLALEYGLPIFKSLEPWVKLDVRNIFDDDTQVDQNTTIFANRPGVHDAICGGTCPTDANGIPTSFRTGTNFGNATVNGHYVVPREYRISAGIRF